LLFGLKQIQLLKARQRGTKTALEMISALLCASCTKQNSIAASPLGNDTPDRVNTITSTSPAEEFKDSIKIPSSPLESERPLENADNKVPADA
jgi:hypothetical protein